MDEEKKRTKEERRDFIKKSLTTATGIAALPLLSATNALSAKTLTKVTSTRTQTFQITPQTKVVQLPYLKGSLAVKRNPNLQVADLDTLMKISIGSLGTNKYTPTYQQYRSVKVFKGLRSSEVEDLALRGLEELLKGQAGGEMEVGCGSCASCCCCCCPCCCCS
jgi:hypothetical protein